MPHNNHSTHELLADMAEKAYPDGIHTPTASEIALAETLSELGIDTDKDWGGYALTNVGGIDLTDFLRIPAYDDLANAEADGRSVARATGAGPETEGVYRYDPSQNGYVEVLDTTNDTGDVIGGSATATGAVAVGSGSSIGVAGGGRVGVDALTFGAVSGTFANADLNASEVTFEIDEANSNLVFKVKNSTGTVKTGSVSIA